MDDLRVTIVQTSLQWHDPEANRQHLAEQFVAVKGQTDLIVLPEMFTSGFTNHPEQLVNGNITLDWLREQASAIGAAITGSIACEVPAVDGASEQPHYVNRLLFVTPEGEVLHYDKVHLFRVADEHKRYQPGHERCVIDYKGWKLLLTICYDLRFPVFCRNVCYEGVYDYDAMICVANWPEPRRTHWRALLQARAIENQAFVIGVNRVGVDGNNLRYSGDFLVADFYGDLLIDQPGEWIQTASLKRQALTDYRQQFPVWLDADKFSLTI